MEIEILPWSLRFCLEDCKNSQVESLDLFKIVAGYFTFVAGIFCLVAVLLQFAFSQPLSHNAKRKRG